MHDQISLKRLKNELTIIKAADPKQFSARLIDNNLFHWHATIIGPPGTPYEGGAFNLDIRYPPDYPFYAAAINFTTPIFHPNISTVGNIYSEFLRDLTGSISMRQILESVYQLLIEPHLKRHLVPKIAELYKTDREKYNEVAKQWTKKYAM